MAPILTDLETLAPRQAEALQFIRQYLGQHGFAPSLGDICEALDLSSRRGAAELVEKLEAKGFIKREPGSRRGIRLVGPRLGPLTPQTSPYQLPLIGRIAAGAPLLSAEHIDDHINVDPSVFQPKAHCLRKIQGWSMRDAGICDGDLVGIHLTPDVSPRQIAAVRVEDAQTGETTLTLKRIRKEGRRLILLSDHADQKTYAPIVVDLRRQAVSIEGVFCGLIRPAGTVPK